MARRKKSRIGVPGGRSLLVLAALVAGLAGGYAWRSYAPLPLPFAPVLGGQQMASSQGDRKAPDLRAQLEASKKSLAQSQEEARRLREQLLKIEQVQVRAEEDIAEIQIRNLLSD